MYLTLEKLPCRHIVLDNFCIYYWNYDPEMDVNSKLLYFGCTLHQIASEVNLLADA